MFMYTSKAESLQKNLEDLGEKQEKGFSTLENSVVLYAISFKIYKHATIINFSGKRNFGKD